MYFALLPCVFNYDMLRQYGRIIKWEVYVTNHYFCVSATSYITMF